jgi:hypothetical protein
MTHTTSNPKIHEGRNLKRFREMLGIKQDVLAVRARRRMEPAKDFFTRTKRKDRFRHIGTSFGYT